MKPYLFAIALSITPITSSALDDELCKGVKVIATMCLTMKDYGIDKTETLKMFNKLDDTTKEAAIMICESMYQIEHVELLSIEGITNLVYQNCLKQ